jgi:hypothetical protein
MLMFIIFIEIFELKKVRPLAFSLTIPLNLNPHFSFQWISYNSYGMWAIVLLKWRSLVVFLFVRASFRIPIFMVVWDCLVLVLKSITSMGNLSVIDICIHLLWINAHLMHLPISHWSSHNFFIILIKERHDIWLKTID